jgi:hypothetical protein
MGRRPYTQLRIRRVIAKASALKFFGSAARIQMDREFAELEARLRYGNAVFQDFFTKVNQLIEY